jgi:hypothetical protein
VGTENKEKNTIEYKKEFEASSNHNENLNNLMLEKVKINDNEGKNEINKEN